MFGLGLVKRKKEKMTGRFYIDGEEAGVKESVVFDGLKRVGLLSGIVEAERKLKSNASRTAV